MRPPRYLQNVLLAGSGLLFAAAHFAPDAGHVGPVLTAATAFVSPATHDHVNIAEGSAIAAATQTALSAFTGMVRPLSRTQALESAFRSYFAYKTAHPANVKKPYLYFVDYGLPSTEARGYVFDMDSMKVVDGPFTVAHGRGSSTSQFGVPTKFSDATGSYATSLGLYLGADTYAFHGRTAGHSYSSVGVRLKGVSSGFNDNAFARGVVAHGAPYVTATRAGRSEGCPAMEPARAQRLLPKIADGGMVFLFAPNDNWLARDPWVTSE